MTWYAYAWPLSRRLGDGMVGVSFYHPNVNVSLHHDADCPPIGQRAHAGQWDVIVPVGNVSGQVMPFDMGQHRYAAESASNEMWMPVVCEDSDVEVAVIRSLDDLLGRRYRSFREAVVEVHCRTR